MPAYPSMHQEALNTATSERPKPQHSSKGCACWCFQWVLETQWFAYARCTGLVYDEVRDVLYESAGLYRESTVREVNVTTGQVIRSVPMQPRDFAEGLALNHDRLVRCPPPLHSDDKNLYSELD
jgi:hypothetical protein